MKGSNNKQLTKNPGEPNQEGSLNENQQQEALEEERKKEEEEEEEEEDLNNITIPEESKVGKKLTDLTTKRVIVLVLSMIVSIIIFDPKFYYNATNSMEYGIEFFEDFKDLNDKNLLLIFNIYIDQHKVISVI